MPRRTVKEVRTLGIPLIFNKSLGFVVEMQTVTGSWWCITVVTEHATIWRFVDNPDFQCGDFIRISESRQRHSLNMSFADSVATGRRPETFHTAEQLLEHSQFYLTEKGLIK